MNVLTRNKIWSIIFWRKKLLCKIDVFSSDYQIMMIRLMNHYYLKIRIVIIIKIYIKIDRYKFALHGNVSLKFDIMIQLILIINHKDFNDFEWNRILTNSIKIYWNDYDFWFDQYNIDFYPLYFFINFFFDRSYDFRICIQIWIKILRFQNKFLSHRLRVIVFISRKIKSSM